MAEAAENTPKKARKPHSTKPSGASPVENVPPHGESHTGRPTSTQAEPKTPPCPMPPEAPILSERGTDGTLLLNEPFIGEEYKETYCYVLPQCPDAAFVIYEIGEGARLDLTTRFGQNFFEQNKLIMRVHCVTGFTHFDGVNSKSTFEVDDDLHWKNNYWIKVEPGNEYVVQLGYRAHGSLYFELIAHSNRFQMPTGGTTVEERHNDWAEAPMLDSSANIPVPEDQWRFNQYLHWRNRSHVCPEEQGYWSLVLHQHLPFIRHTEYDIALEEQWYFEAVASVYTQLLAMFWRLEREKIDFRITVSLTPPLLSMMRDPLLQKRARRHLLECIKLAEQEYLHADGKPWKHTIEDTLNRFREGLQVFDAYEGDLTRGYRDFQNMGKLEVITCAATHALLPFYIHYPEAVRAQLQTACSQYEDAFGRWPRGIWLPEHAFTPGLDAYLAESGIRWFLTASHGLLEGDTKCWYGTARPVVTQNGVAAFGVDEDTRHQIWSRENGYPGDPRYKEWYRDLGYDMEWDHIPRYFKEANVRRNTGIKYYRITDRKCDLGQKAYYHPDWARAAVGEHSGQFVYFRGLQATNLRAHYGVKPITVSAYDAELFGHWWEEGPAWIESVFRKMLYDQNLVRPVTPSEFLHEHPRHQKLMPAVSSWGREDYFQTWLNGREYRPNQWIYRHFFRLINRMIGAATVRKDAEGAEKRALDQAAREIFLAQASDWAFLIDTQQAARYSEIRTIKFIDRANQLLTMVEKEEIDETYLHTMEFTDTIFPGKEMDFRRFCRPE